MVYKDEPIKIHDKIIYIWHQVEDTNSKLGLNKLSPIKRIGKEKKN